MPRQKFRRLADWSGSISLAQWCEACEDYTHTMSTGECLGCKAREVRVPITSTYDPQCCGESMQYVESHDDWQCSDCKLFSR